MWKKLKRNLNLRKAINEGNVITESTIDSLQEEIEINNILLEKNIKPINENTSMEVNNFLKVYLDNGISMLLVILMITITCDIVSSEVEKKTKNLLFTQPISKNINEFIHHSCSNRSSNYSVSNF